MRKMLCFSVFLLAACVSGMVHAEEPPVQRGLDLNREILYRSKNPARFVGSARYITTQLPSRLRYEDFGIGDSLAQLDRYVMKKSREPDLLLWVLPEEDSKIPAVEKLVHYANFLIEKYNADVLKESEGLLREDWNAKKGELKRQYTAFRPGIRTGLYQGKGTNAKISHRVFFVSNIVKIEDETPERDEFFLFVAIKNLRPVVCGGDFPLVDEDCFCLLSRTEEGETLFRTFSLEKYLESEQSPRTPWILWDKDGKIAERETRELMFQDYEPESFLSGNPVRREATE